MYQYQIYLTILENPYNHILFISCDPISFLLVMSAECIILSQKSLLVNAILLTLDYTITSTF